MAKARKSVNISSVILLIVLVLGLVYGLNTVLAPRYPGIKLRGGFSNQQPRHLYPSSGIDLTGGSFYIDALEKMVGGLCLALTVGTLIVLFTAYRKAEKWAWYYMLGVSVIGWVNTLHLLYWHSIPWRRPVIVYYSRWEEPSLLHAFNNPATNPIVIIGFILTVIGILIPVKEFLGKKQTTRIER